MILKFLGRGSAFNVNEGNTSAYIKQDKELFLIDCGENIFDRILAKDLLNDVDKVKVLITHLNSDHVGSLSSLIFYCFYVKNIIIDVYYPNVELHTLLSLMGNTDVHYNFHMLDEDTDNSINSKIVDNINCFDATHINNMKCYCYVIFLTNEKTFYYSGDSSCFKHVDTDDWCDWINEYYQDTSLADYDGNVHMSLRKLCESVDVEKREKVYCMHIDNDALIDLAKSKGFNVVKVE